ncbi:MAG: CHAT domain-containing protein [Pseudomonadota bacterium]
MRLFTSLALSVAVFFGAAHAQRFDCKELQDTLDDALLSGFGANYFEEKAALDALLSAYDQQADDQCLELPSRARILMLKAVSESNVREFMSADESFDRAEIALAEANQDNRERDEQFLEIFRIMHNLNQRSEIYNIDVLEQAAEQLNLTSARGAGNRSEAVAYISSLPSVIRASMLYTAGCAVTQEDVEGCSGEYDAVEEISDAIGKVDDGDFPKLEGTALPRYRVLESQIFLARGEHKAAWESIDRAIRGWRSWQGGNLASTPLSARAHFFKGRIELDWGIAENDSKRIEDALESYREGIDILVQSPGEMDYDMVWAFLDTAYSLAESDPSRRDDLYEDMFRAIQIIRSTEASSAIADSVTKYTEGLGEGNARANRRYVAWQEAEDELRSLRGDLPYIELTFGSDSDQVVVHNEKIVSAQKDVAEKRRQFERRDNKNLAERLQQPVDVRAVMDALEKDPSGDAAYLVTASGQSETGYVFLVDAEGLRVQEFDSPVRETSSGREPLLQREINRLRTATRLKNREEFPRYDVRIAHRIYDRLYGGLRDGGRALESYASIHTTAIGPMQELPLSMLITEDPQVRVGSPSFLAIRDNDDYTGFAWLGNDVALTYLPAVPNFVALSNAKFRRSEKRALLAGGFVHGQDYKNRLRITLGDTVSCQRFVDAITELKELPDTEAHLAEVSAIVGNATIRSGTAFSNAALRQMSTTRELETFGLVHLYTHGFLPPKNTCFPDPFIVTTPDSVANDAVEIPGLMTDKKIRELKMNAQLVFVSACNSAGAQQDTFGASISQSTRAESLSGLARSFLEAGARSIVVAHWTIYDDETRDLVQAFYRHAQDGETTIAGALRDAAKDIRSTPLTSHPIYWAGFVTVGAGSQVLELENSGADINTAALSNGDSTYIQ